MLKNKLNDSQTAARALCYEDINDVPNIVIIAAYLQKAERLLKTNTLTSYKFGEISHNMEQGAKYMEIEIPFKFLGKKSVCKFK